MCEESGVDQALLLYESVIRPLAMFGKGNSQPFRPLADDASMVEVDFKWRDHESGWYRITATARLEKLRRSTASALFADAMRRSVESWERGENSESE